MRKSGFKCSCENRPIELASHAITINSAASAAIEPPINTQLLQDEEKLAALLAKTSLRRLGQPAEFGCVVAFSPPPMKPISLAGRWSRTAV